MARLLDAARSRLRRSNKQKENAEYRRALIRLLPAQSIGAEVGVWKGDFSVVLLEQVQPVKLHLVDPWSFQSDVPKAWYGGASATSQLDMDAIHRGVCTRFAGPIASGVVQVHRLRSVDVAGAIEPGALDWVYIDGDHRYEAVRDELELFQTLVRPGGIVAGDDYHSGGWWQGGVKRAVDEWAETANVDDLTIIGSQFVARLRATAAGSDNPGGSTG